MPNISWNEIGHRALLFSREWQHASSEQADKQTFWNEFFNIFGISRRMVASFEEPVRRLTGTTGFIDLFWPGKLLVEHKTAGHSLDSAQSQAFDYIRSLIDTGRRDEAPRYILLSDFRRFVLYDLEPEDQLDLPLFHTVRYYKIEFALADLRHYVSALAFIPNYTIHKYAPQDPANLKAVALMAALHDTLKSGGYSGHSLERFLVRVLFCLFAEDTGIFEPDAFQLYIENRTQRDGSDLGIRLARLFDVLNTQYRQTNLDETLAAFPYVNGQLFAEHIGFADFNAAMREALLRCCRFDWSRISPAIFGALFQEVMTDTERRHIGAHYTSERDILKVINPLFMDGLRAELLSIENDRSTRRASRLSELRERLTQLRFLDPACGCGNFLVIAYRELSALELDLLKLLNPGQQQSMSLEEVNRLSRIDVDQFYGIEIEEWPARIAEVALWLMDHQSNMRIHEAFSQPCLRLPLRNSPHIHHGNALRMDWNSLLPNTECSYVLGNPPFVGHHYQSEAQKFDQQLILHDIAARGVLDYVANWYIKAAEYIADTNCSVAFVSTNSICQGEQAGILWTELFSRYLIQIVFAYQTFPWESEARGKAHVHVVIVAFTVNPDAPRLIFKKVASGFEKMEALNISPYLVPGPNRAFLPLRKPVSKVPQMFWGNKPTDGGHLIFSEEERAELLTQEPQAKPFIRRYMSGSDLINGDVRYCLWLVDATPAQLKHLPQVRKRLEKVAAFRLNSKAATTRAYANRPALFRQISQPSSSYLAIPEVSSEQRSYIPMAMVPREVICSNTTQFIPDASSYHFAVLTSAMHVAWVRRVAGRLKSDLRYSNSLVYNNFPWPNPTKTQLIKIEQLAQAVLAVRSSFPDSTLAALYDPLSMKPQLIKAHHAFDRAVDRLYRSEPFADDQARVEHLFALYEQLTAPLLPATPRRSRRRAATT